jgi:hypothetical protein
MTDRVNTPAAAEEPMTLELLIQKAYQIGSDTLLVHNQTVLPMFTIVTENHIDIIATPWADELEKAVAGFIIKAKLREANADAYSFITECWTAKPPPDWQPGMPRNFPPASENPNRKEALIAIAVSRSGEKLYRSWEIIRSPAGQAIALEVQNPTGFETWLGELFQ